VLNDDFLDFGVFQYKFSKVQYLILNYKMFNVVNFTIFNLEDKYKTNLF